MPAHRGHTLCSLPDSSASPILRETALCETRVTGWDGTNLMHMRTFLLYRWRSFQGSFSTLQCVLQYRQNSARKRIMSSSYEALELISTFNKKDYELLLRGSRANFRLHFCFRWPLVKFIKRPRNLLDFRKVLSNLKSSSLEDWSLASLEGDE